MNWFHYIMLKLVHLKEKIDLMLNNKKIGGGSNRGGEIGIMSRREKFQKICGYLSSATYGKIDVKMW